MTLQIDFQLYHRGDLLRVRAHMHEDCLSEDGGGAAHVEEVQLLPPIGLRIGAPARIVAIPLDREAVLAAHDAVEEICRVAASLRGTPWAADRAGASCLWAAPVTPWRQDYCAWPDERLLALLAGLYSQHQESRHAADHPTEPSDAQTYREEAPYGSER